MAFPSLRAKLFLATWLENHTEFRLPSHSKSLPEALKSLEQKSLETPLHTTSYLDQFCTLKRYFNRTIFVLLLICFALGIMAVPPVFATDQANQANVFWLLIVLLGFHSLNLIIWLATLMTSNFRTTGAKGIFLSSLIFITQKVSKHLHIKTDVSHAFLHWQCQPNANKWLISTLSHIAWGCYLLAGWLMTLVLLLTNQVNFVWETTLLSDQAFLTLTDTLSVIPNWLGIRVPNQLDVLASRVDLITQTASTRQHWANFLLASLMLYGVLPRLVLALFSLAMYQLKRATQPISTQEKIIQNRYQDAESQNRHIIDNDKHAIIPSASSHGKNVLSILDAQAFKQDWGLFEWSTTEPSYLHSANTKVMLNSREQQDSFLTSSSHNPVYILVDGNHSPDRGTRRFFLQANVAYSALRMVISQGKNAKFAEQWLRLGQETSVPSFQPQAEE
ncbi:DUF2868 domain-containing protein [Marinomonas transparens]|uniref:DUF2868 domain-containing protein n=1 Tax=Marinomonas transparens TaxID=2795388 RepID=A0A934JKV8_9GAMM|nr:DUF2868 domain-containing protein [Marinomonas transparens]MBJ7538005.1 DUF2868 domain-containing protein [Marinomonas transparens]